MADVAPGDTYSVARSFSREEVRAFAEISRDRGYHHVVTGDTGEVAVHGLLTATLPTMLGRELDFVARTVDCEFVRPVYTGDRIECEVTVTDMSEGEQGSRISLEATCTNEDGDVVMRGEFGGIVFG